MVIQARVGQHGFELEEHIGLVEDEKALSGKVREGLKKKVDKHNEKYGDKPTKRANLRMLIAVFKRGVGAYRTNPQSVRPNVKSPEQWAYSRVYASVDKNSKSHKIDKSHLKKK